MKKLLIALLMLPLLAFAAPGGPGPHDAMRGASQINETTNPPPLLNPDNSDVRRSRNYAMQPPVIPHKVEGYQVDKNANRCMMCHARTRTQESQAPMISVTHFMDRNGQVLADVTPRRYFCTACHVQQTDAQPLVPSTFKDMLLIGPEKK